MALPDRTTRTRAPASGRYPVIFTCTGRSTSAPRNVVLAWSPRSGTACLRPWHRQLASLSGAAAKAAWASVTAAPDRYTVTRTYKNLVWTPARPDQEHELC